ncbi:LysM peptidoglycan-binding domain-containing protein [Deinococcus sp. YIM 134068]|uniref:C40 family peptidase n=1 Tax=Deinococcus lichenicola TaxID=3118910 RepID=UPI002F95B23F
MSLSSRLLPSLALLALTPWAGAAVTGTPTTTPPTVTPPAAAETAFTVTVQPGDTAFSLARAHGLSVEALLALNGLSGPELRAGQVLRVREVPPYTVGPGETLYSLARRFGVSVDALLAANTLPEGAVLQAGQVLRVPLPGPAFALPAPAPVVASPVVASPVVPAPILTLPPAVLPSLPVADAFPPEPIPAEPTVTTPPAVAPLPGDWRGAALALLGVPYVYGGNTLGGLDCSGLVLQVFTPLGVALPRRSADQAQVGEVVPTEALQPGDLVFFDIEGRGTVSHVGIYLGDDEFVNANSYRGQVVVDRLLTDRYWAPRFVGARRVLPLTTYGAGR